MSELHPSRWVCQLGIFWSISHTFWYQLFRGALAIESATILAGVLTMTGSGLKCYLWRIFFYVFNYLFLKIKMYQENMLHYWKFNVFNPYIPNTTFLFPLKTSENVTVSEYFQEVGEECLGNVLGFGINIISLVLNILFCKYVLENSSFYWIWNKGTNNNSSNNNNNNNNNNNR